MDALNFENGKVEKSYTVSRFHHLRNITKLFRIIDFRFLLIFLTWASTHVPFVVRISGEYFRQLMTIVISPLFIFIISNIIVLTLLFQSGFLFPQCSQINNETKGDLYEGFIINSDYCTNLAHEIPFLVHEQEDIVYQDKQTIFEEKKVGQNMKFVEGLKVHRRSQSESSKKKKSLEVDNFMNQLRRSKTEKCWKVINSGKTPAETVFVVDEMSNEEFQRAIEDFIAKQIKFHREEKLSVVISSHTSTCRTTSKGNIL
ncbi:hypothetical protein Fot_06418 [Forsythia ovata]|uniref:DUF4408 domain-containing protein n=1 Tax=Forsythia ovata TaxID=205694 RepID=A0ABD1WT24_9LAMI